MLLKRLIKNCPRTVAKIKIKGIATDSREVKKNYIFFALKGKRFNGENFVNKAFKNGALVCIVSNNFKTKKNNFLIIKRSNIKKLLLNTCLKYYKKKPENIFAVTGTNGKSSVAEFFKQILSLSKYPVATIGTLGIKIKNLKKYTNLTSPDLITLHKNLNEIKKNKVNNVMIETSSHGLVQGRCDGINFKSGIFTNFSQDHLDYHKNMKNYFDAKMILFKKLMKKNRHVIINKETEKFHKIKKILVKKNFRVIDIKKTLEKLIEIKSQIKIYGDFQLKNLSAAIEAAKIAGLKEHKIFNNIKKIKPVEGRLEFIKELPNKSKIFVDFAHTPNALDVMLTDLKNDFPYNNLTIVFGCGGERDKKKRKLMASIVRKHCNKIYVTDDNPRNENPKDIRKEIISSLKGMKFFEIGNREIAIKTALKTSSPNEIIVVAGKGHEALQDYGNRVIRVSDKKIINSYRFKKNKLYKDDIDDNFKKKILNNLTRERNLYKYSGVSIDSKTIKKKNMFIALKGNRNDGHDFTSEALRRGASFCVISKKKKISNSILVKNTHIFLKNLGEATRSNFNGKIIGITGSSGKTSLKNLIGETLSKYKKTYYSPKSYNNKYGVPLSLSNLDTTHKFGVFEIGMSKKGEVNTLSKLVKPNIGIITNIGEAHIENFKDINGIAKAKAEIINNIIQNGTLILKYDDNFCNLFKNIAKKKKLKVITFGFSKKSDIYLISSKVINKFNNLKIKIFKKEILLKSKNLKVENILATLAVLSVLRLNSFKFLKNVKKMQAPSGRGMVHKIKRYNKSFTLVDESYNANPQSVKKAIANFSEMKIPINKKKYLLLGDMLELGKKSIFFHREMSKMINKTDIDKLFVIGKNSFYTYKHTNLNKRGNILQSGQDFDEIFSKMICKGDFLMIKGSNAIGLNNIAKNIIKGKKNVI